MIGNVTLFEQNRPEVNGDVFDLLSHPMIEKFLYAPNRYYAILDQANLSYKYVSSSFKRVTGYETEFLIEKGPAGMFDLCHPESQKRIIRHVEDAFKYVESKKNQSRNTIVLKYWFEWKNAEGGYDWYVQEATAIPWQGKYDFLFQLVIVSKMSHPPLPSQPSYVLYDFDEESSFINWKTFEDQSETTELTKRQVEVLQLLVQGFSAKEIADQLFVAETTIISHRKNLMEKCACRNLAELIRFTTITGIA